MKQPNIELECNGVVGRGHNRLLDRCLGEMGYRLANQSVKLTRYIVFGTSNTAVTGTDTGISGTRVGYIDIYSVTGYSIAANPKVIFYEGLLTSGAAGSINEVVLHDNTTGKGGSLTTRTPACMMRALISPAVTYAVGDTIRFRWTVEL